MLSKVPEDYVVEQIVKPASIPEESGSRAILIWKYAMI